LSVIFTNMISGRHPWYSAEASDRGFAAFRADNNYLLNAMKITRPANALLKRCFHMNPLRRPTLAEFREAVDAIDSFSTEHESRVPPPLPPRRLPRPLPQFPVTATTFEWDATPSFAAGDCEKTPKPACTFHMPQPIMFTPFDLDSSLSSLVAGPPSSDSDSSAPSVVSVADSSPPPTPATFPADPADIRVSSSIPSLADCVRLPALPKRAYLGHLRPARANPVPSMITKPQAVEYPVITKPRPIEYRTVASNGRPTLPTRKQFLTARRIVQVKEV
jgi:hypothetical protein